MHSRIGRRAAYWIAVAAAFFAAAELTARIYDRLRDGTPLLATPSLRDDLMINDSLGTRGRPHGQYKSYRLNSAGFQGPELADRPAPGCRRVMVLGASETFGAGEEEGGTYSARLADTLRVRGGCYEVVNAGVVGLALPGILHSWRNWWARFEPQIVVIYPSPVFYLADAPQQPPAVSAARNPAPPAPPPPRQARHQDPDPPASSRRIASRFLMKVKDHLHYPEWIQRRRVRRWLTERTSGHDAAWFFAAPPPDRLAAFGRDLETLVSDIRVRGATPVLVTHAMRFSVPPRKEDEDLLQAWRQYTPRATEVALLGFEQQAAAEVRNVASRQQVPLVDAAAIMSGHPAWFTDFVHFTPLGAEVLAGLIASTIEN